jgi:hypothetical protein
VPVKSGEPCIFDVDIVPVGRYREKDYLFAAWERSEAPGNVVACDARKPDVDDGRIRHPRLRFFQSGCAIKANENFITMEAQQLRQRKGGVPLVVADNDPAAVDAH